MMTKMITITIVIIITIIIIIIAGEEVSLLVI